MDTKKTAEKIPIDKEKRFEEIRDAFPNNAIITFETAIPYMIKDEDVRRTMELIIQSYRRDFDGTENMEGFDETYEFVIIRATRALNAELVGDQYVPAKTDLGEKGYKYVTSHNYGYIFVKDTRLFYYAMGLPVDGSIKYAEYPEDDGDASQSRVDMYERYQIVLEPEDKKFLVNIVRMIPPTKDDYNTIDEDSTSTELVFYFAYPSDFGTKLTIYDFDAPETNLKEEVVVRASNVVTFRCTQSKELDAKFLAVASRIQRRGEPTITFTREKKFNTYVLTYPKDNMTYYMMNIIGKIPYIDPETGKSAMFAAYYNMGPPTIVARSGGGSRGGRGGRGGSSSRGSSNSYSKPSSNYNPPSEGTFRTVGSSTKPNNSSRGGSTSYSKPSNTKPSGGGFSNRFEDPKYDSKGWGN